MEQARSAGVSSRSSSTIKPIISFGSGGVVSSGALAFHSDGVADLGKNHTDGSCRSSLKTTPVVVEVDGQAWVAGDGDLTRFPRFSHGFNASWPKHGSPIGVHRFSPGPGHRCRSIHVDTGQNIIA